MNLREALQVAKRFVMYGDPNGDFGSFEPVKAHYDHETGIWEVLCRYTKYDMRRTAKVEIDDESEEIVGFELQES